MTTSTMALKFLHVSIIAFAVIQLGECVSKIADNKPHHQTVDVPATISKTSKNETLIPTSNIDNPQSIVDSIVSHNFLHPEKDVAGRFILAHEIGSMMCQKSWEIEPTLNIHHCFACFNSTVELESEHGDESHRFALISKEIHILKVEHCFNTFIHNSSGFYECLPMLRNPNLPNKDHDILILEPPFHYSYRNFARCANGVIIKQESEKCFGEQEIGHGFDVFLHKFSCVYKNLRRFSEFNFNQIPDKSASESSQLQNHNATSE